MTIDVEIHGSVNVSDKDREIISDNLSEIVNIFAKCGKLPSISIHFGEEE